MTTAPPKPTYDRCDDPAHESFGCPDIFGVTICATCFIRHGRSRRPHQSPDEK